VAISAFGSAAGRSKSARTRSGELVMVGIGLAAAMSTAAHAEPARMPQPPLVFVADPKLGMEAGIRSVDSVGRVLFRYDELLPRLSWNETTGVGKAAGVLARTGQLLLVDLPVAEFETMVIHEAFGHGARAVDLGRKPTYSFPLPGLYCIIARTSCIATTAVGVNHDILITLGGLEAGYLTGYWITLRAVQARGWLHQGDYLVYLYSKLRYFSLQSTDDYRSGGGPDVGTYVTHLQDDFGRQSAEDRTRISSRLRTAALWNLADPILWYSFYAAFARGVWQGERWTKAPIHEASKTTFYTVPRFGLTPFGAEHYVDLFLGRGTSAIALYGRVGSSGEHRKSKRDRTGKELTNRALRDNRR